MKVEVIEGVLEYMIREEVEEGEIGLVKDKEM